MMKRHAPYFLLIFVILVIDQITKFLIAKTIPFYGSRPVIRNFFNLTHIHNKGAIFGMFGQTRGAFITILLTAASLVALAMVVYYFFKTPASQKGLKIALTLVLAGAIGNQIDRVVRGYVIDFLDVRVNKFAWPTFNVADSCITVGALLLIFVFFVRKS